MEQYSKEIKVKVTTQKDIQELNYAAQSCPRQVSVKAIHSDYCVDARSLLGLYSLNLSEVITIKLTSVNPVDKYVSLFANFIVDKWHYGEVK